MVSDEDAEALPKISNNYLIERQILTTGMHYIYGESLQSDKIKRELLELTNLEIELKIAHMHGINVLRRAIRVGIYPDGPLDVVDHSQYRKEYVGYSIRQLLSMGKMSASFLEEHGIEEVVDPAGEKYLLYCGNLYLLNT